MSRLKTVFAALALSLLAPGLANAAVVSVRDNPDDNGSSVFASGFSKAISIQHDGTNRNVRAGVFSLQYNEGDGWVDFYTFCLQLSEFLSLPRDHERVDGETYFASADDVNALGVLYGSLMTTEYVFKNAASAAAAQAIVWEITEDGADSFDLTTGDFILFTADVLAEANALWAVIISGDFLAEGFDIFAACGTQDLITSSVPIPGAFPLLLSGLAGFGFASRKKRQAS